MAIINVIRYGGQHELPYQSRPRVSVLTSILIDDTVLYTLEALASSVSPPLFQLALLVVESTSGVESVLQIQANQ